MMINSKIYLSYTIKFEILFFLIFYLSLGNSEIKFCVPQIIIDPVVQKRINQLIFNILSNNLKYLLIINTKLIILLILLEIKLYYFHWRVTGILLC